MEADDDHADLLGDPSEDDVEFIDEDNDDDGEDEPEFGEALQQISKLARLKNDMLAEFFRAVRANDSTRVQELLADGVDINSRDPSDRAGKTAFLIACSKGLLGMAKMLRDAGANTKTQFGMSSGPLDLAAKHGHIHILKYLIEELKMDPKATGTGGLGPIHWACAMAQLEAAKMLVEYGADINAPTSYKSTPFWFACAGRSESLIRWLVTVGADVNRPDASGIPPLHALVKHGYVDIVQWLVENSNVDLHQTDSNGRNALEEADAHNMSEVALYLWKKGLDIESSNNKAVSFVHNTRLYVRPPSGSANLIQISTPPSSKIYNEFTQIKEGEQDEDPDMNLEIQYLDLDEISSEFIIPFHSAPNYSKDTKLDAIKRGKYVKISEDGLSLNSDYPVGLHDWPPTLARATRPFEKADGFGYFEIQVVSLGTRKIVTIGLTNEDYDLDDAEPGWHPFSYGWHADDGFSFHNGGQGTQFAARWSNGDVIGCGVNFDTGAVFFTRNGEFIGAPYRDANKFDGKLFPTIGMENEGASVKVNFGASGPFRFNFEVPVVSWKPLMPMVDTSNLKILSSIMAIQFDATGRKLLLPTSAGSYDVDLDNLESIKTTEFGDIADVSNSLSMIQISPAESTGFSPLT